MTDKEVRHGLRHQLLNTHPLWTQRLVPVPGDCVRRTFLERYIMSQLERGQSPPMSRSASKSKCPFWGATANVTGSMLVRTRYMRELGQMQIFRLEMAPMSSNLMDVTWQTNILSLCVRRKWPRKGCQGHAGSSTAGRVLFQISETSGVLSWWALLYPRSSSMLFAGSALFVPDIHELSGPKRRNSFSAVRNRICSQMDVTCT